MFPCICMCVRAHTTGVELTRAAQVNGVQGRTSLICHMGKLGRCAHITINNQPLPNSNYSFSYLKMQFVGNSWYENREELLQPDDVLKFYIYIRPDGLVMCARFYTLTL